MSGITVTCQAALRLTVCGFNNMGRAARITAVAIPADGGDPMSLGTASEIPDGGAFALPDKFVPIGEYRIVVTGTSVAVSETAVSCSIGMGVVGHG